MEMYNAWSFIKEDDQVSGSASKAPKKHSFSRHETSSSSITSGGGPAASTTSTHCSGNIKLLPKTRSTRTPSASALLSNSNILTGDTTAVPLLSPNLNGAHTHGPILGHQNAISNGSSQTNMNEVKLLAILFQGNSCFSTINPSAIRKKSHRRMNLNSIRL